MLRSLLLAATVSLAAIGAAHASVVTMETRFSNAGPQSSAAAYQALIDGLMAAPATSGFGTRILSSFNSVSNNSVFGGANRNIAYRYTINFGVDPSQAGNWDFRLGVDFGRGGAVFLDGAAIAFNNGNMWWSGSYLNPAQSFQFTRALAAGNHTMVIYGLEDCCDGGQQGQFRGPNQASFATLAANDPLVPIPEPMSLALFGAGLAGLGLVRRRPEGIAAALPT